MATRSAIDVSQIIDNSRIGTFQISIFLLCFICLAMDGFDVQSLGYVAPALREELHISREQLGPVLSASAVGILFGSILFSALADRIGRRPVLIACTFFFAILTFLTARASSLEEMRWLRVIGGLGMGAIMPNAMALVNEYSPARHRVTLMMVISNGFTAGAAFGGFVAAWMLPLWGWRSVFYFGAAVPMLIAVIMIFMLPESLQFLTLQGKKAGQVTKWLRRVNPKAPEGPEVQYRMPGGEKLRGLSLLHLFKDGRAMGTLLLWLINFMNLFSLYLLQGWLTQFMVDAKFSQSTAALIASMVQVGGILGGLTLGWFVHKSGFVPVLATCAIIASATIALIGQPWMAATALFIVVFIAGYCVTGGQAAINALGATYFPADLRSTGVGSGLGVGRLGAIVGPTLVSVLHARLWSASDIFLGTAVAPLILLVALLAFKKWGNAPKNVMSGTAAPAH
jgi:AAHS family 4-hydroxybenzoate transporter-like MFS transporter